MLRLREGAKLEVCDGNGGLALAELRGIAHNNKAYVETTENRRQVFSIFGQSRCLGMHYLQTQHLVRMPLLTCAAFRQVEWQGPKWEVVAACFSLKGGRADWLVEKCTEMGAWGLRPILSVRSPHLGG